ncbi:hypothetical protein BD410DRAFT_845382 [Rickenella mellea]|uniref:Uncharacterized protein n=1 Tax=Rickenella mellea TaxID=50990 RepID=A0A4Y7PJG6_9AGAM|nr:hypothetical protein BD410DRAFT_845382 [Rickenella mellea]
MPDEVLSLIFESGHRMSTSWTFAKSISQVSHRFRGVSLNTPLLWTRIFCWYKKDQIETFIRRSGRKDLIITTDSMDFYQSLPRLSSGGRSPKIKPFLRALKNCTDRWSHIETIESYSSLPIAVMEELNMVDFPRLQSISSLEGSRALSKWKLPSLSHVGGVSTYFRPEFPFLGQLTSFTLHPGEDRLKRIECLTETLYSMKSLRHFSITLRGCCQDWGYTHEDTDWDGTVVPDRKGLILDPHSVPIDLLQIHIEPPADLIVLRKTFESLLFLSPSTQEVYLETSGRNSYAAEDFLLNRSHEMVLYGSTISLQIVTNRAQLPSEDFPVLTELVTGCKIVDSVRLETSMSDIIHEEDPVEDFSNLHHLTLQHCHKLTEADVQLLVQKLMGNADPAMGLKLLELISCRQLSEEFLLDLGDEFGTRVKWKVWGSGTSITSQFQQFLIGG